MFLNWGHYYEKNTLRDDARWNLEGRVPVAEHLPEDQTQRDKILMAIMGSGNDLEIDGIGGGNPLTSKVAIISRSSDPRADVDYLFAQVIVH